MPIPDFIKKKIDAKKPADSSEDSGDTEDSSSADSADAAVPPKPGAKKVNPLMAWAKSRA